MIATTINKICAVLRPNKWVLGREDPFLFSRVFRQLSASSMPIGNGGVLLALGDEYESPYISFLYDLGTCGFCGGHKPHRKREISVGHT
ncbi:hypothetical protein D3C87_1776400 [compost metagenome]